MRFTAELNTYAFLPIVVAVALGGCDKLIPNGASGTIALLRSGSEQVCVASEVQDDLRGLILPKPNELGADVATQDAQSAIATAALSFDATTLQSADKSVAKVSCTTNVRLSGSNGEASKFRINYDVSPSAENPNHVVVSADTDDARAFARVQINNALAQQNATKAQQQEAVQANQAHQLLLATVTPKWLVGSWIPTNADATLCSNGQAYAFRANHLLEGTELSGRWVLNQDNLHAVGQGTSGGAELDGTITAADPLSFTLTSKDGSALSFRRCTRAEINAGSVGLPDTFAPVEPAQN